MLIALFVAATLSSFPDPDPTCFTLTDHQCCTSAFVFVDPWVYCDSPPPDVCYADIARDDQYRTISPGPGWDYLSYVQDFGASPKCRFYQGVCINGDCDIEHTVTTINCSQLKVSTGSPAPVACP